MLLYWRYAETYYPADGPTTSELRSIREALGPLRLSYGHTPATEFGPLAPKAVREQMILKDWCRTHINHQVNRIRRMFRWAASEELIPAAVYHALLSVPGLAKGRCGIRESPPVEPAFWAQVEAVLPYCPRTVATMLQIQWLTGMRSSKVRIIRTSDLDCTNPDCWLYPRRRRYLRGGVEPLVSPCRLEGARGAGWKVLPYAGLRSSAPVTI